MSGIIATLWPAIFSKDMIEKLYKSGVRILRFNFPHAKYDWIQEMKSIITEVEKKTWWKFMLLCDTEWPWIRTWILKTEQSYLEWEIFKICIDHQYVDEAKTMYCSYPYIIKDLKEWDIVKIDSGLFDVEVVRKTKNYLYVKALSNAIVGSQRHINLPRKKLRLPTLSDKDKQDISFCIKENFRYVAMSFVRNAEDIRELRNYLYDHGASHLQIIAKIETQEAVDNISEIIRASDAIMVARGDLGTEMPIETIPWIQQHIVWKVKRKWKKVIVATQMLESMIENPIPTRAEVSDIFLAVREWADFVMLSWETAVGKFPIECVKVMNNVIAEANKYI